MPATGTESGSPSLPRARRSAVLTMTLVEATATASSMAAASEWLRPRVARLMSRPTRPAVMIPTMATGVEGPPTTMAR